MEEKKEDVKENIYIKELKQFLGKDVMVESVNGKKISGKCLAVNFTHLNIVIETADSVYLIKNISDIKRSKEKGGGTNGTNK